MKRFAGYSDQALIDFWNEGDGGLSWLVALEDELKERGYVTRSTDPADGLPRVGGERLVLKASA